MVGNKFELFKNFNPYTDSAENMPLEQEIEPMVTEQTIESSATEAKMPSISQDMPVSNTSMTKSLDTEADAVMESLRMQLSNGLEEYFQKSANGKAITEMDVNLLYVQSMFVDGTIDGNQYTKYVADIGNGLYQDTDEAMAWVSSIDRNNNPYHYEPAKQGQAFGTTTRLNKDMEDVNVSLGALGIQTNLSQEQLDFINKLQGKGSHALTEAEQTELYAKLVSDNFQANNDVTDLCKGDVTKIQNMSKEERDKLSGNLVVDDGQGVKLDVSEMTMGQKTRLTGKVKKTDVDGKTAEDALREKWADADKGTKEVTMEVCGGTLSYKGGNNFHFKSEYMGEFDYNPQYFQLAYKTGETTVNGEKQEIAVPILHAQNFEYDDSHYFNQFMNPDKENSGMNPPKGLKVGDYMFDGCSNLKKMPPLPDSLTSAHGMFADCTSMTGPSHNFQDGVNTNLNVFWDWGDNYGKGGTIKSMPKNLEDVSYMFTNCEKMDVTFTKMGEKVWDARGMYQGCSKVNDMVDMSNCKYLLSEMTTDMYTGCNSDLNNEVKAYCEEKGRVISEWTGDGAKNTMYDRARNGVDITDAQWHTWQKYVDTQDLIKKVDPSGKGAINGAEAMTNGMVGYSMQRKEDGTVVANNSTWAHLRDNYDKPVTIGGNEMLDKGLAFLGTMGLSSAVLGGVTKSKWIGLIGGVGIAVGLQSIGVANKISPLLRSVGDMIGAENGFGKGLHNLADKLEGSTAQQNVRDVMGVEELFDTKQKDSIRYTESINEMIGKSEDGSQVATGFYMKYAPTMMQNGKALAEDGSLEVMAYTSEDEYQKSCNSTVMNTACDGMMSHINQLAGENGQLTEEQKKELQNNFAVMLYNVQAYSVGAEEVIAGVTDPAKADRMRAGLGKVMRNTSEPVYSLICQMDAKYHILDDESRKMLDTNVPYGVAKFSDYQKSYNQQTLTGDIGRPSVDLYVSQLQAGVAEAKQTETLMKQNKASAADIRQARMDDLERNYGWMMDLAEANNVKYSTGLEDVSTKEAAKASAQKDKEKAKKDTQAEKTSKDDVQME